MRADYTLRSRYGAACRAAHAPAASAFVGIGPQSHPHRCELTVLNRVQGAANPGACHPLPGGYGSGILKGIEPLENCAAVDFSIELSAPPEPPPRRPTQVCTQGCSPFALMILLCTLQGPIHYKSEGYEAAPPFTGPDHRARARQFVLMQLHLLPIPEHAPKTLDHPAVCVLWRWIPNSGTWSALRVLLILLTLP